MTKANVSEFSAPPTASIRDVIKCIDRSRRISIALIVDDAGRLLNTITDGDIRRGILRGVSMDSPVTELLPIKGQTPHPRPVTAPHGTDSAALLRMMQAEGVRQMPIVDAEDRVIDVVILPDLLPKVTLPLRAVIMAGGFGKRLAPLTDDTPKPMLRIEGRPFMELIIEHLKHSGIRKINVTTHFKPEKIVEHFGDGRSFGVEIDYINEEWPLGTGGALGLMPVPTETTLIVNGDVLTQVDFHVMLQYHREHRADMSVAVSQYALKVPYGVVECDGVRVCRLKEKPQMNFLVNAGIYLLEPSVYEHIAKGEFINMTDVIQRLLDHDRCVVSFPVFEQWLDIGHHVDYARAQEHVTTGAYKRPTPEL